MRKLSEVEGMQSWATREIQFGVFAAWCGAVYSLARSQLHADLHLTFEASRWHSPTERARIAKHHDIKVVAKVSVV